MQLVRTTVRMPEELHDYLKREAELTDKSLNDLLVDKLKKSSIKEIRRRQKALREMKRLVKGIDMTGVGYKELIEDGRRY